MSRLRGPGKRGLPTRLRRARSVLIYWREGELAFENYLTRSFITAERVTVEILDFFDNLRPPEDLLAGFPGFTPESVRRSVRALVRAGFLVREGSPQARQDQTLSEVWKNWLPQASFHFSTKDTPFIPPDEWPQVAKQFLAESAPPSPFKTYPRRSSLALPRVAPREDAFSRALLARKTHREFSGAPVSKSAIGELLHYTWGAQGQVMSPTFGPLVHKTSPSGGARHPGEVYLVALDIEGLKPGTYHYHPRDHVLERVAPAISRARLLQYAAGQQHVADASAVFLMTASFPRSMWKYRSPRAYRVVTLDAGHLAQTFCLVATWLGLAPFTTAALKDTAVEAALGLDGITESVLYLVGVGMPQIATATGLEGASSPRRRPSN